VDEVEQRRGRRHLGEAKWRELLERFEASRDTVEAFCRREGVTKSSFQRWRLRIADGGAPMALAAQRPQLPVQAGFVDLGMMNVASGSTARLELTLDLGGGVTLRVVRG
jgi:hypothetical protein